MTKKVSDYPLFKRSFRDKIRIYFSPNNTTINTLTCTWAWAHAHLDSKSAVGRPS